ncbi:MAG: alpha-glucan family phosphorylase [Bryobacteraceae bacterium]
MRFHVHPLQQFLVRPALPESLPRLPELANNVLWSWDHTIRALFRRLDPQLWLASGHNPILMLSQVPQSALQKAAADPRYQALYRQACANLDSYAARYRESKKEGLIAYFCMEYGVVQCLPIYSGGLGILAGDHMKGASDFGLNLVGVGLLYQQGYFRQSLNPDGWQQERYPVNDFYTLPITEVKRSNGEDLHVTVDLPTGPVFIKVWQMEVGAVKLYLLDTNIAENTLAMNRDITDQLYGGDGYTRIRQEIVLGIGGLRALAAMGIEPSVFHMNEGHSAFLAIERIRVLMRQNGLSFQEAWEATRVNNVFTTHTAVPAGFDFFEPGLVYEYFNDYCEKSGIPFDALMQLGRRRRDDPAERFSMAVSALNTSSYRNAVSRLHRDVSQEMFQDMWPQLPTAEVPITSVTNGVHLPSWVNGDLAALYDQYLQPDWQERHADPRTWEQVKDIPDSELWEVHRRRKRRLVQFVRERVQHSAAARKASTAEMRRLAEVLDPEAFTIGFSRRFATYKRATLLIRDVPRLKRILNNPEMPVQVVIAGKAHPKDHPGKSFIREIYNLSRDPEFSRRLVFVEDYSIEVGRELVQGVDLWLNNPRRPEEACGTSGMKASINGVLNLSILDGWFDEAYEYSGGWAIGDRVPYTEDQDDLHATNIYSLLENDIVPLYYKNRDRGVPEAWIPRVKQALMHISPQFNMGRMLGEYYRDLYYPAHRTWQQVQKDNFAPVRERTIWTNRVFQVWDRVHFIEAGPALNNPVLAGSAIDLRATVNLAGLAPSDVRVEAVVGRVGFEGSIEDASVISMSAVDLQDDRHVFAGRVTPERTGRMGYAFRISPNHSDDPLTRPCGSLMKWA